MISRLLPLLLTGALHAQEITTHHLMQAICQIETGCVWLSPGRVKGEWQTGSYGEVGPWQISPAVLQDLGISRAKVSRCCLSAERATQHWLDRLHARGLSHVEVAAAYHRGYVGRGKTEAKAYAERAMNLAERIASESVK